MGDRRDTIEDLRGRAHALAHRLEQAAEMDDLPMLAREHLIAASRSCDVVAGHCRTALVVVRPPREQSEDDPAGCIPNERLEKAWRDAMADADAIDPKDPNAGIYPK